MVAPFCYSLPVSFASQNPPPSSEGGSTQTSFFIVHRLTSFEPRDYRVVFVIQQKNAPLLRSIFNYFLSALRYSLGVTPSSEEKTLVK